ncbi:MAG TPA: hypothetical protein DDW65_10505 [Firmicutes bacterium]|jgi:hypothetical protein|nr:hypothetical protein [Bacillota bacterium]
MNTKIRELNKYPVSYHNRLPPQRASLNDLFIINKTLKIFQQHLIRMVIAPKLSVTNVAKLTYISIAEKPHQVFKVGFEVLPTSAYPFAYAFEDTKILLGSMLMSWPMNTMTEFRKSP